MPGELLTVLEGTSTTDGRGNDVIDWDDPTETDYEGTFAPSLMRGAEHNEHGAGRTTVVTNSIAYFPPGATVTAANRVRARGDDYEINGPPAAWTHPVLGPVGVVVELRKVEG